MSTTWEVWIKKIDQNVSDSKPNSDMEPAVADETKINIQIQLYNRLTILLYLHTRTVSKISYYEFTQRASI